MEQVNRNVKITEKVKEINLTPIEIEQDAYIVLIEGWRMRVYFEEGYIAKGGSIDVEYTGNIKNPHSVQFKKLK